MRIFYLDNQQKPEEEMSDEEVIRSVVTITSDRSVTEGIVGKAWITLTIISFSILRIHI